MKPWDSGKEVSQEETGEVREHGRVFGVCSCVCLKQHESPRYSHVRGLIVDTMMVIIGLD